MKKTKIIFWVLGFLLLTRIPLTSAQPTEGDLAATLQETYGFNAEQTNKILSSVGGSSGASLFSMPNLIGAGLFGLIGFAAFVYGKKQRSFKPLIIGIILMVYPYVILNTLWLYAVGIGLCFLLYFWRD